MLMALNLIARKKLEDTRNWNFLERGKAISCLELQPIFDLIPKQIHNGKTIRKVVYKADFKYFDNNKKIWIVEDVKGFKTDVYKLKKKMFLFKYGNEFKFLET